MFWCSTKNRRQYLKAKEEQCINVPPRYVNCHLCVKTAVSLYNANRTLFHKCRRRSFLIHDPDLIMVIFARSSDFCPLEILLDPQNICFVDFRILIQSSAFSFCAHEDCAHTCSYMFTSNLFPSQK